MTFKESGGIGHSKNSNEKTYVVINSVAFTYVKSYLIKTIGIKAKVSPKKCVREMLTQQFDIALLIIKN